MNRSRPTVGGRIEGLLLIVIERLGWSTRLKEAGRERKEVSKSLATVMLSTLSCYSFDD